MLWLLVNLPCSVADVPVRLSAVRVSTQTSSSALVQDKPTTIDTSNTSRASTFDFMCPPFSCTPTGQPFASVSARVDLGKDSASRFRLSNERGLPFFNTSAYPVHNSADGNLHVVMFDSGGNIVQCGFSFMVPEFP
jgi:hypothetical protein